MQSRRCSSTLLLPLLAMQYAAASPNQCSNATIWLPKGECLHTQELKIRVIENVPTPEQCCSECGGSSGEFLINVWYFHSEFWYEFWVNFRDEF